MKHRKGLYRAALRRLRRGEVGWLFRQAVRYRRIRRALKRADGRTGAGPVIAHVFATARCDSRCRMCDIPERAGDGEFTTGEFRELLRGLAGLGVAGIAFTGGEPTLRPDIHELLSLSRRAGLETVLATNGLTLEGHIDGIIEAGTGTVNISLDGGEAAVHDAIRGVDGAFARTAVNVRRLADRIRRSGAGTDVVVSAVLQSANSGRGQVDSLLRRAVGLGANRVIFCPVHDFDREAGEIAVGRIATDYGIGSFLLRHPLRSRIDNSDRYLVRLDGVIENRRPPAGCVAGYTTLFVDWEMNLYPCKAYLEIGRPLANLRADSRNLAAIWYGEEFNAFRRFCSSCRKCFLTVNREFDGVFR